MLTLNAEETVMKSFFRNFSDTKKHTRDPMEKQATRKLNSPKSGKNRSHAKSIISGKL
jgi:hypothetical protein